MRHVDYDAHNAEVEAVWASYHRGEPIRAPMILGINVRYTMWRPDANPQGISFEQYFSDPDKMAQRQLEHQDWVRRHVPQDAEMGDPPADGWELRVDFLNSYEAGWFDCPIRYFDAEVPDTEPILSADEDKHRLFDAGIPHPYEGGLMRRNWEFYEHMRRLQESGFEYLGRPIKTVWPAGLGTDGPLTVACNLRGAAQLYADLALDPEYARQLLDFIADATIARIQAYRRRLDLPEKTPGLGYADDAIQSISTSMYQDLVMPSHERLIDGLSTGDGANGIHLCGDATHHFPFLRDTLDIQSFDTGFPVDFAQLRRELGPGVEIKGGPSVMFLEQAGPTEVNAEVARIMATGVGDGGRLILREGNNLPPDVDLDTLWAFYDAVKEHAAYEEGVSCS